MLRCGQEYVDAGAHYYEIQYRHRGVRTVKQRAAELGYEPERVPDPRYFDLTRPSAVNLA
jgi:hypothetical protein